MPKDMTQYFMKEKQQGRTIKYLRIDNAGVHANKVESGLDIIVEYTTRDTPQQNLPSEQILKTIYGKAKASLSKASVPMSIRYKVFPFWITTVAKLEHLCVVKYNGKNLSR